MRYRSPGSPYPSSTSRREFLARCGGLVASAALVNSNAGSPEGAAWFATRGVVLVPEDLSLEDWPARAARAGLTTVALHHQNSPQAVVSCIRSERGRRFLDQCRRLGLHVEYELHAMKELLPRGLFSKDRSLFRMNEQGERVNDANCCVHSPTALDLIAENATSLARQLAPTTGRYFLWGDDGQPWCRCPKCRGLSEADQALVMENHLVKALRRVDPKASLAHLAYSNTLSPPKHVKPLEGVFLEYAPIQRRYDLPYAQQAGPEAKDGIPALDANLEVFPRHTAQVLEYWLDVSRFSSWKRPGTKLPWNREVVRADLETYAARGIRHITTFAAWVDADYARQFGEPLFIGEYGEAFRAADRK